VKRQKGTDTGDTEEILFAKPLEKKTSGSGSGMRAPKLCGRGRGSEIRPFFRMSERNGGKVIKSSAELKGGGKNGIRGKANCRIKRGGIFLPSVGKEWAFGCI